MLFRVFIVPCFFFLSFGKPRDPFASSAERECVFARGACSLRRDFGRRGGLLRRPLFFGRRESPRRRTSSSSSARRERDGEGFFSRFFPSGKTTPPQTGERERERLRSLLLSSAVSWKRRRRASLYVVKVEIWRGRRRRARERGIEERRNNGADKKALPSVWLRFDLRLW